MRELRIHKESWPVQGTFTISRGSQTSAEVLMVEIRDGEAVGRGESLPYARYQESMDSVIAQIESIREPLENGLSVEDLQETLSAGAARNAVDCALWDLEAKRQKVPVWKLLGLPRPKPRITAYTISVGDIETVGATARKNASRPLLKLKLDGGEADVDRVRAVRVNAPGSGLIVDANEAWTPGLFQELSPVFHDLGVALIEQPLPAGKDQALADFDRPVPVCADESCHTRSDLERLEGCYDYVNVKLDKTGGLTEAMALAQAAREKGLGLMVGCMLGTSLAMAPALLPGQHAGFLDLDGPLLLARDRDPALHYDGSSVHPADPALWG